MKKINLFSSAFVAALMLASCSAEDAINGGNTEGSKTSYLAVNLVDVNKSSTRAADYDLGTSEEQAVKAARFYFFDNEQKPYQLADGTNFVDENISKDNTYTPSAGANVEEKTSAIVIIDGVQNSTPKYVVTVLNPTASGLDKAVKTIDQLKEYAVKTLKNDDGFVMSTSVYANGTAPVYATNVEDKIKTDKTQAENDPQDIYVERVAAKVNAKVNSTATSDGRSWEEATISDKNFTNISKGQKILLKQATTKGEKIYAVVLGWGISEDMQQSHAIKNIEPATWTDDNLGFTWNKAADFRSFWAKSFTTSDEGVTLSHPSFTEIAHAIGTSYVDTNAAYTHENTSSSESEKTKLIVAVQLQYENGTAAEICKYNYREYAGETATKTAILEKIGSNFQYKTTSSDATYTNGIAESDVDFADHISGANMKDYQVALQLTTTGEGKTWQIKGDDGNWTDATKDQVNTALAKELAEVRKSGHAYYFANIQHLATDANKTGFYGVVRNHSYQITLDDITGFGTPVYNPSYDIDPIVPTNTAVYLAARINVLSWRLVPEKHITLGE